MKFPCTIFQTRDGQWRVQHDGPQAGPVQVAAPSRDQALEKMRGELQYRLELCPCSGESYRHIEVEIVDA